MLCPCGYEMKPTDLDCPRCAKFAAEGTPVAAAPAPASQAGASPANPVYVEDPYVHYLAKREVDSSLIAARIMVWLLSLFLAAIVGIVTMIVVLGLEAATGFKSVMLTEIAFVCGLVVMGFATKGIHQLIVNKLISAARNRKSSF